MFYLPFPVGVGVAGISLGVTGAVNKQKQKTIINK